MTLTPLTIEQFSGLNLVDDPLEVGATGCVDGFNAWVQPGRVETVPEIQSLATGTRAVRRIYTHRTQLLASESDGANTTLEAFDASGVSLATATYASASVTPHGFATIGTSTAQRSYAVRGTDTPRRWDGAAWTAVAAVPVATSAAVADNGTRLAIGQSGGNVNRVEFSAAGDPETFTGTDWVDIAPGDGETIITLIAWTNLLFAFKNTKYAVFYGTSIDSDGSTIFNYRMVDTGIGIGRKPNDTAGGGACAGPDGVYFIAADGIYRTQGGAPELVSRAISPLWPTRGAPVSGSLVSGIELGSPLAIGYAAGDLYATVNAVSKVQTLVLRETGWTYLTVQASGSTTGHANVVDFAGKPAYVIVGSTAIKRLSPADGPDTTIAWTYKSGRYSPADGRVTVTNETSLVGTGTVFLRLDSDLYSNQTASVALGTPPTVSEGFPAPVDQEGTWLQFTLSATGEASVSRLTHELQFAKPVGVR